MKVNKKLINLVVIMVLLVASVFLTACSPGGGGGGNNNGGGNNSGGNGGGITIPETPGSDEKLEDLFSKFKIIKKDDNILVADPTNNNQKTNFNVLLNRQISVLSEDLIYRLTAVYGAGAAEASADYNLLQNYEYDTKKAVIKTNHLIEMPYRLAVDNEPTYLYSTGVSIEEDANEILLPNIKELASYAFFIKTGFWEVYSIAHTTITRNFRNTHAINGGFSWNDETKRFNDTNFNLLENSWKWDYSTNVTISTNAVNVFEKYKEEHLNKFKLAIANILAFGNNTSLYETNYDNVIKKIDYLGFKADEVKNDRESIVNFIKNTVIGTENINKDNTRKQNILSKIPTGILTTESIALLSEDDHYYKAYELLVPALVERAFSNSFGGAEPDRYVYNQLTGDIDKNTDGTLKRTSVDQLNSINVVKKYADNAWVEETFYSLYPKMTRSSQQDLNIADLPDYAPKEELTNLQKVILQPKADVSLLELWFLIGTEENVKTEFKVNVKYVANGVTFLDNYVSSFSNNKSDLFTIEGLYDTGETVAGEGVNWYYDLNVYEKFTKNSNGQYVSQDGLHVSEKYPVMGAYNGKDLNENQYNIWKDNPFQFNTNNFGDNYVELTFDVVNAWKIDGSTLTPMNNNDVKFTIGFTDPMF